MAKRLKTYRLEPDECADFAAAVAETGETESEVVREAIRAYIQRVKSGRMAPMALPDEVPVYTDVESSESYVESSVVSCPHPAVSVDELGMCHECGTDVW